MKAIRNLFSKIFKAIRNLFSKIFSSRKAKTVVEVKETTKVIYNSPRVGATIADKYSPSKLSWNGFTGSNKDKKKHFNKKRHGKQLKRKHKLAA